MCVLTGRTECDLSSHTKEAYVCTHCKRASPGPQPPCVLSELLLKEGLIVHGDGCGCVLHGECMESMLTVRTSSQEARAIPLARFHKSRVFRSPIKKAI